MRAYLALLLLLATAVRGQDEDTCLDVDDNYVPCDFDAPVSDLATAASVDTNVEYVIAEDGTSSSNQGALTPADPSTAPPAVGDAATLPSTFPQNIGDSIPYSLTFLGGAHTIEPERIKLSPSGALGPFARFKVTKVLKTQPSPKWKLHKISANYYAFEYVGDLLSALKTDAAVASTAKLFLTVLQPTETVAFPNTRNRFHLQQYLDPRPTVTPTIATYLNNPVVVLSPFTSFLANGLPSGSSFGKVASFQAVALFEGIENNSFQTNKNAKKAASVAFAPAWTYNTAYNRRYLGVLPVTDTASGVAMTTDLLLCPYKYVRNTWSANGVNDYSLSLLSTGRSVAFELP